MATPKKTLAEYQKQFPVGATVSFSPGRGAPAVTAKVTGVRQAGQPGTRGHSVFVDTVEDRGEKLKAIERSARPGTCTVLA